MYYLDDTFDIRERIYRDFFQFGNQFFKDPCLF